MKGVLSLGGPGTEQRGPGSARQPQDLNDLKPCTCRQSRCLKLYCLCFHNGVFCTTACKCIACLNQQSSCNAVLEARNNVEARNPDAFKAQAVLSNAGERRGCNCKRSRCLKKYCDCFDAGLKCSAKCRCVDCLNSEGDPLHNAALLNMLPGPLQSSRSLTPTPSTDLPGPPAAAAASDPQAIPQRRRSGSGSAPGSLGPDTGSVAAALAVLQQMRGDAAGSAAAGPSSCSQPTAAEAGPPAPALPGSSVSGTPMTEPMQIEQPQQPQPEQAVVVQHPAGLGAASGSTTPETASPMKTMSSSLTGAGQPLPLMGPHTSITSGGPARTSPPKQQHLKAPGPMPSIGLDAATHAVGDLQLRAGSSLQEGDPGGTQPAGRGLPGGGGGPVGGAPQERGWPGPTQLTHIQLAASLPGGLGAPSPFLLQLQASHSGCGEGPSSAPTSGAVGSPQLQPQQQQLQQQGGSGPGGSKLSHQPPVVLGPRGSAVSNLTGMGPGLTTKGPPLPSRLSLELHAHHAQGQHLPVTQGAGAGTETGLAGSAAGGAGETARAACSDVAMTDASTGAGAPAPGLAAEPAAAGTGGGGGLTPLTPQQANQVLYDRSIVVLLAQVLGAGARGHALDAGLRSLLDLLHMCSCEQTHMARRRPWCQDRAHDVQYCAEAACCEALPARPRVLALQLLARLAFMQPQQYSTSLLLHPNVTRALQLGLGAPAQPQPQGSQQHPQQQPQGTDPSLQLAALCLAAVCPDSVMQELGVRFVEAAQSLATMHVAHASSGGSGCAWGDPEVCACSISILRLPGASLNPAAQLLLKISGLLEALLATQPAAAAAAAAARTAAAAAAAATSGATVSGPPQLQPRVSHVPPGGVEGLPARIPHTADINTAPPPRVPHSLVRPAASMGSGGGGAGKPTAGAASSTPAATSAAAGQPSQARSTTTGGGSGAGGVVVAHTLHLQARDSQETATPLQLAGPAPAASLQPGPGPERSAPAVLHLGPTPGSWPMGSLPHRLSEGARGLAPQAQGAGPGPSLRSSQSLDGRSNALLCTSLSSPPTVVLAAQGQGQGPFTQPLVLPQPPRVQAPAGMPRGPASSSQGGRGSGSTGGQGPGPVPRVAAAASQAGVVVNAPQPWRAGGVMALDLAARAASSSLPQQAPHAAGSPAEAGHAEGGSPAGSPPGAAGPAQQQAVAALKALTGGASERQAPGFGAALALVGMSQATAATSLSPGSRAAAPDPLSPPAAGGPLQVVPPAGPLSPSALQDASVSPTELDWCSSYMFVTPPGLRSPHAPPLPVKTVPPPHPEIARRMAAGAAHGSLAAPRVLQAYVPAPLLEVAARMQQQLQQQPGVGSPAGNAGDPSAQQAGSKGSPAAGLQDQQVVSPGMHAPGAGATAAAGGARGGARTASLAGPAAALQGALPAWPASAQFHTIHIHAVQEDMVSEPQLAGAAGDAVAYAPHAAHPMQAQQQQQQQAWGGAGVVMAAPVAAAGEQSGDSPDPPVRHRASRAAAAGAAPPHSEVPEPGERPAAITYVTYDGEGRRTVHAQMGGPGSHRASRAAAAGAAPPRSEVPEPITYVTYDGEGRPMGHAVMGDPGWGSGQLAAPPMQLYPAAMPAGYCMLPDGTPAMYLPAGGMPGAMPAGAAAGPAMMAPPGFAWQPTMMMASGGGAAGVADYALPMQMSAPMQGHPPAGAAQLSAMPAAAAAAAAAPMIMLPPGMQLVMAPDGVTMYMMPMDPQQQQQQVWPAGMTMMGDYPQPQEAGAGGEGLALEQQQQQVQLQQQPQQRLVGHKSGAGAGGVAVVDAGSPHQLGSKRLRREAGPPAGGGYT